MKFRLELNELSRDYRASEVAFFRNDVCCTIPGDEHRFFVNGVQRTREDALSMCEELISQKWEKKLITHKRVRVSVGASKCAGTYREVWVKR